jgi:hypothetical protein
LQFDDHNRDSGRTHYEPGFNNSEQLRDERVLRQSQDHLPYHQWKKAESKFELMHTTTRESVLELALATADDPSLARHFKDAADAYEGAPVTTKNAPIGSITLLPS